MVGINTQVTGNTIKTLRLKDWGKVNLRLGMVLSIIVKGKILNLVRKNFSIVFYI